MALRAAVLAACVALACTLAVREDVNCESLRDAKVCKALNLTLSHLRNGCQLDGDIWDSCPLKCTLSGFGPCVPVPPAERVANITNMTRPHPQQPAPPADDVEIVETPRNRTRHANDTTYPTPPTSGDDALPGRRVGADFTACPSQCNGHGWDCVAQVGGSAVCVCAPGYGGDSCARWVGCSGVNFCSGHGRCSCASGKCECECANGWTGADCNEVARSQCKNQCSGRGQCHKDFTCECDTGFTGDDCSRVLIPSVCDNACSGQGICDMTARECRCVVGASDIDCSVGQDPCNGCRHGTCGADHACKCDPGYTGTHCDQYTAASDPCAVVLGSCSGRGVCLDNATCACQDGFEGPMCNQVSANGGGCPNNCVGRGVCDAVSGECQCNAGWTGPDCTQPLCPHTNHTMCSGNGVCEVNSEGQGACVCDPCFSGDDCSENALHHCPNQCSSHGDCACVRSAAANASSAFSGECRCHEGWEGAECQFRSDDSECCPLDCSGNGECKACTCECFEGWGGSDCAASTATPIVVSDDADALDELPELLQTSEAASPSSVTVEDLLVTAEAKQAVKAPSMAGLWD